jgi:hypothetical protein
MVQGEQKMENGEEEENDEKELENGLLELVKCAARSKRLQQGLVFDESYEIDVTSEVKFVAISTSLPLGGRFCLCVTLFIGCFLVSCHRNRNQFFFIPGRSRF